MISLCVYKAEKILPQCDLTKRSSFITASVRKSVIYHYPQQLTTLLFLGETLLTVIVRPFSHQRSNLTNSLEIVLIAVQSDKG